MDGEREGYRAYLLRFWRVRSGGKWVWRATLESPHTAERQVFTDLPDLFAYLERRTSGSDPITLLEDEPEGDGREPGVP